MAFETSHRTRGNRITNTGSSINRSKPKTLAFHSYVFKSLCFYCLNFLFWYSPLSLSFYIYIYLVRPHSQFTLKYSDRFWSNLGRRIASLWSWIWSASFSRDTKKFGYQWNARWFGIHLSCFCTRRKRKWRSTVLSLPVRYVFQGFSIIL